MARPDLVVITISITLYRIDRIEIHTRDHTYHQQEEKVMSNRGWWNMGLSIVDPEMEKLMERIARAVPMDSPLRSTIFARVFAVVKAWAESRAESMADLPGTLVEKLTDYGDFFVANLTGSGGGSSKKVVDGGRDWMDKFLAEAGERLKKAPTPEEARVEAEKIKAEFALRRELLKVIEEARREATPPATKAEAMPSIDWPQMQARLIAVIGTAAAVVDNVAEKAAVPVGKFAGWLESQKGGKR